ncbi:probable insulin-like peptide 1 [Drosophila rhopaloa]|uniref:Probable insulin-like peptide 1 n=1 Tax=Drosophila rhopaloa TaxID=1041015 RepID=A0A6P4EW32_DRORH|nr:probable insulin-like peptide 1 [Drosophila rhopaloa]
MFCKDNGAVHGLRLLQLLIATILAAVLVMASGHQLPPGSHKLCGSALSDAMDVVCAHGYNSLPQKRGVPSSSSSGDEENEWQSLAGALTGTGVGVGAGAAVGYGYSFSPLLTNLYGAEVLIKTRRHRRHLPGGVYDECCVKSCSYEELAAYCLPK